MGKAVGRRSRAALAVGAATLTALVGATPALADAGKVLVFTGTAGTVNAATADAASAVQALGADNKLICFLHPKSTNGVLIELCQEIR